MPFWTSRSPGSLFEQRFEADGDAFLFRRGRQGLQVRVSAAERDEFVTQFHHGYRLGNWLLVGLLITASAILMAIYIPRDQDIPERLMQATVWLIVAGFVAGYCWLWFAPNRVLSGRAAIGPPLTRIERRDRALDKLNWFQVLGLLPIGVLIVVDAIADERTIPQLAKAAIGLLLIALCVRSAALKFRRRRRSPSTP